MKIILKSLLILLIANVAIAQKIKIGTKGSLNFSNVTKFNLADNLLPDFNLRTSGSGAIFAEIPISPDFSFRPEVGYLERGSKLANISLGDYIDNQFLGSLLSVDAKIVLKYIDVPFLMKYKFAQTPNGHAYVLFGPGVGFKIDESLRLDLLGGTIPVDLPLNLNYNTVDFSGHVGLGYKFGLSDKVNAFIETKYQHGFTNVVKDIGFIDTKTKNRGFGISAGISIPIGK